jgi:hypothetical protein
MIFFSPAALPESELKSPGYSCVIKPPFPTKNVKHFKGSDDNK